MGADLRRRHRVLPLEVEGLITATSEATLYSTAEPCFLCSFAIREAGLRRVVIGAPTPDIGGVASRYPILVADDVVRWGPAPEVVWL